MILASYMSVGVSTAQHSSQGNQWCRGSAVEAREVVVEERTHPKNLVNSQVTRDPITELSVHCSVTMRLPKLYNMQRGAKLKHLGTD